MMSFINGLSLPISIDCLKKQKKISIKSNVQSLRDTSLSLI